MYRNAGITGKQGTVVRRKPRFNPILGTFGAAGSVLEVRCWSPCNQSFISAPVTP